MLDRGILRLARQRLRAAGVVGCYGVFGIGGAYLSFVHVPWLRVRSDSEREFTRRSQTALAKGFVWFSDLMRRLRLIDFDARQHADCDMPTGPVVMVANHPSIIDVIHLIATHPNTVSVVSAAYYENSLLRPLLEATRHIKAGEGPNASVAGVLDEAVARLKEGHSVLIFPEGTRSPMHGMHKWARGAFEIASRAQVPVVPFVITCDPPALKKGMPFRRHPDAFVEYRLTQLPPVEVGPGRAAVRAAAARTEELVSNYLYSQEGSLRSRLEDFRSHEAVRS